MHQRAAGPQEANSALPPMDAKIRQGEFVAQPKVYGLSKIALDFTTAIFSRPNCLQMPAGGTAPGDFVRFFAGHCSLTIGSG
jgi:hypothetical protein